MIYHNFKKKKTPQKSPFKIFCFNKKGPRETEELSKTFQQRNLYNPSIKSTTYTKPFMPISWSNFIEEHHKFSSDIWDKIFTNWFTKCSDGQFFFIQCKLVHLPLHLNPAFCRCAVHQTTSPWEITTVLLLSLHISWQNNFFRFNQLVISLVTDLRKN